MPSAPPASSPTDLAQRLDAPQRLDDLLLYRLYRLHASAAPLVVRLCEQEFHITRREWRVLSCVASGEGLTSSELAQRAMLDRARTSRTLTRLVDKGLVKRVPKPSDRREVHVFLTDDGRALHQAMFPRVVAVQHGLLSALSADERALFSTLLQRLQERALQLSPEAPMPAPEG